MRLLNVSTFTFEEFYGNIPPYAILSHTWGEGEVLLQHIQDGTGRARKGWSKIKGCCSLAAKDGWKYVWIDTCCIDKTSSADLSEAINSMFTWYQKSSVCYAYLNDVRYRSSDANDFRYSRWFTRGWTLQELLAPTYVVFLDDRWNELGTKSTLKDLVSEITRISIAHLTDFKTCSIATKMSWAARRETTRVEDTAYCLMGLFGINMPLLYGEGKNAFFRLQLELIKSYNDESIFAWQGESNFDQGSLIALLAESPTLFANSAEIELCDYKPHGPQRVKRSFAMTNNGLSFVAPLYTCSQADSGKYLLFLNCAKNTCSILNGRISIQVSPVQDNPNGSAYYERVSGKLFAQPGNPDVGPTEMIFKDHGGWEARPGVERPEKNDLQKFLFNFKYSPTLEAPFFEKHVMHPEADAGFPHIRSLQSLDDLAGIYHSQIIVATFRDNNSFLPYCFITIVRHLESLKIQIWSGGCPPDLNRAYKQSRDEGQVDADSLVIKGNDPSKFTIIWVVLRPRGLDARFKNVSRQFDVIVTLTKWRRDWQGTWKEMDDGSWEKAHKSWEINLRR